MPPACLNTTQWPPEAFDFNVFTAGGIFFFQTPPAVKKCLRQSCKIETMPPAFDNLFLSPEAFGFDVFIAGGIFSLSLLSQMPPAVLQDERKKMPPAVNKVFHSRRHLVSVPEAFFFKRLRQFYKNERKNASGVRKYF